MPETRRAHSPKEGPRLLRRLAADFTVERRVRDLALGVRAASVGMALGLGRSEQSQAVPSAARAAAIIVGAVDAAASPLQISRDLAP